MDAQYDDIRIAIVTWTKWKNYGTFLQMYALQTLLKEYTSNVKVLSDANIHIKQLNEIKSKNKKSIKNKIIDFIYKYILSNKKKLDSLYLKEKTNFDISFQNFIDKYIDIDYDTENLNLVNNRYNIFVAGSDQIWSPLPSNFHPYYYLNFTDKTKVSYAPSCGAVSFSDYYITQVEKLLKDFKQLSVREQITAATLSNLLKRDFFAVLDPTLVLPLKKWESLLPSKKSDGNYILCYFLSDNLWYRNAIKELNKNCKCKIINIATSRKQLNYFKFNVFPDPIEFLSYIKNASYIITDSFHGTIFSLIFSKDFITLKRFDDENGQNIRVENLLSISNLERRFIGEKNISDIKKLTPIDYDNVHRLLDKERTKSIQFIKDFLATNG